MVDRDKIFQKIRIIEENLEKLRGFSRFSSAEFKSDFRNIETGKHLLQTSIGAMIDIGTHIIAHKKLRNPESSADVFNILCDASVINSEDLKDFQLMAKFRNRIVHFYQEISNDEIYNIICNKTKDFEKFIKSIVKLL